MRVLVTGGRDYRDEQRVYEVLEDLWEQTRFTLLIQGGASGADTLAAGWAMNKVDVHSVTVYAKWNLEGRAAGHLRNQAMLKLGPDQVVAFPGGRGTAHMVRLAKAAGVPVLEVT